MVWWWLEGCVRPIEAFKCKANTARHTLQLIRFLSFDAHTLTHDSNFRYLYMQRPPPSPIYMPRPHKQAHALFLSSPIQSTSLLLGLCGQFHARGPSPHVQTHIPSIRPQTLPCLFRLHRTTRPPPPKHTHFSVATCPTAGRREPLASFFCSLKNFPSYVFLFLVSSHTHIPQPCGKKGRQQAAGLCPAFCDLNCLFPSHTNNNTKTIIHPPPQKHSRRAPAAPQIHSDTKLTPVHPHPHPHHPPIRTRRRRLRRTRAPCWPCCRGSKTGATTAPPPHSHPPSPSQPPL